jgi:GT2 family glycosyltransferase
MNADLAGNPFISIDNPNSGTRVSEERATVAVVILNWNGWRDTIECLESLQHLDYPAFRILIIDNGSMDDSLVRIRAWCEGKLDSAANFLGQTPGAKPVVWDEFPWGEAETEERLDGKASSGTPLSDRALLIIRASRNLGFAGGCNAGIRFAMKRGFRHIWLLNNDTVVDPEALSALMRTAESDDRVGIVGSKILFYDFPSLVQSLGSNRILWPAKAVPDAGASDGMRLKVKWVYGTSVLLRAETLEATGLFDERFFMYAEDEDLCVRAEKRGWGVWTAVDSIVWHKWASSSNVTNEKKRLQGGKDVRIPWRGFLMQLYYQTRNGIFLAKKNFPSLWLPYLILRTAHLLAITVLRADRPGLHWSVILKGTWDGVRGRMGRVVEPPLRKTAATK